MAEEQAEAQQDSAPSEVADVKLPLKMRLKAWWDGEELVVRQKQADAPNDGAPAAEAAPGETGPVGWTEDRIALVQEVWGEGHNGPAGDEMITRLVKPVGLTPAMRMLDLGTGLGGGARLVAKHFGVWVSGLEADQDLAEAGAKLSAASEFAKKATVKHFDPAALAIDEPPFDCVLSKEFFFQVEDKQGFLETLCEHVKAPGHLIFTDYVQPAEGEPDADLAEWIEAEAIRPHLWTRQAYVKALGDFGFDVRVEEDFTQAHKGEISGTWAAYMEALQEKTPDLAPPPGLAYEVGLWMRRVKLMEKGALGVCRIHAVRKDPALLAG